MITAVFDCVVYVQAVLSSRGPAFACFELAEAKQVALHLSPAILDEVKRTLARPSLRRKYSSITDARVAKFLEHAVNAGTMMQDPPQAFALSRDPKDEPYLNLAVAANATHLVTRENDLLSLMAESVFRTQFPALSIVDPSAFLAAVRKESGAAPG
jgi:uncharacterized protein